MASLVTSSGHRLAGQTAETLLDPPSDRQEIKDLANTIQTFVCGIFTGIALIALLGLSAGLPAIILAGGVTATLATLGVLGSIFLGAVVVENKEELLAIGRDARSIILSVFRNAVAMKKDEGNDIAGNG